MPNQTLHGHTRNGFWNDFGCTFFYSNSDSITLCLGNLLGILWCDLIHFYKYKSTKYFGRNFHLRSNHSLDHVSWSLWSKKRRFWHFLSLLAPIFNSTLKKYVTKFDCIIRSGYISILGNKAFKIVTTKALKMLFTVNERIISCYNHETS
jgi:hypothetical protein